jgi:transposase
MALSEDRRNREEAVVVDGLSRNAAAALFKVSIGTAVRWVKHFEATGDISPRHCGGDRPSGRIEVHHDYSSS